MLSRQIFSIFPKTMSTRANDKKNVVVQKVGVVTTIGINRPNKRNCINRATAKILEDAITNFEDSDSNVAVLYGIGGNFCSGFDLEEIETFCDSENNEVQFSVLPSRRFIKKPTVAALSGYTVAGGLELALLCDLRVIEETAIVGLYGRRFGVPLTDGATVRLPAVVGLSRALDLILTGRSLTAKEAFEWGLANRIVACGTGLGQAIQLATCLDKFSQECLNSDRNSTYNAAFNQVYNELLDYEKQKAKGISLKSMVDGARRFLSGIGKHGKAYNLTEKDTFEWEKEYSSTAKSKL